MDEYDILGTLTMVRRINVSISSGCERASTARERGRSHLGGTSPNVGNGGSCYLGARLVIMPFRESQTLFKGDGEATTQSAFPARRSESQGRLNSQRERETRTKKEGKRERGERRTDVDGKMRKNAFIMFSQRSFNGRPEICAQRAGDE